MIGFGPWTRAKPGDAQLAPESPSARGLHVGDPLPRYDEAIIDPSKLRDYALSLDHHAGGPKARVFLAILDIGREDWAYLRNEILRVLPDGRVRDINPNPYTTTYGVVLPLRGLNGRVAPVITAWELRVGIPRLVSARVDFKSLSE